MAQGTLRDFEVYLQGWPRSILSSFLWGMLKFHDDDGSSPLSELTDDLAPGRFLQVWNGVQGSDEGSTPVLIEGGKIGFGFDGADPATGVVLDGSGDGRASIDPERGRVGAGLGDELRDRSIGFLLIDGWEQGKEHQAFKHDGSQQEYADLARSMGTDAVPPEQTQGAQEGHGGGSEQEPVWEGNLLKGDGFGEAVRRDPECGRAQ